MISAPSPPSNSLFACERFSSVSWLRASDCKAVAAWRAGLENSGVAYRIPIQQGNLLEPGAGQPAPARMAKRQVRHLMGTPMLVDPFHQDRWDYVYTFRQRVATARSDASRCSS